MPSTMRDLWLVAWLRWRQAESTALFWLSLVGYTPGKRTLSDRLYELYLAGFGLWWVTAMLAIAFYEAVQVGNWLGPEMQAQILRGVPGLVLAVQVALAVASLRSSPFKLTFPDAAYVAGSPVSRAAPVFVGWLQAVAKSLLVAPLAAALVAVALTPAKAGVDQAALRAALAALPPAVLVPGLAWCLGLSRLACPALRRLRLVWLSPLLLFVLAWLQPALGLWPGQVLALAIGGQAGARPLLLLALLSLASGGGVAWLGGRANMTDVLSESTTYARLQLLGYMGRISPELANSIRAQAALAARRPLLHLPRAQGLGNLLARAALVYLRRPGLLLWTLVWSGILLQASLWLVPAGAFTPPWIFWLLAIIVVPPQGLLDVFQVEATNPFLRQFLPAGNLKLLCADAAVPLAVLVAAASLARLLWAAPVAATAMAVVALVILGALLALCQGVSLVKTRLGRRIRHPLAAVASFGAVITAHAAFGSPLASLGVGAALAVALGALIADRRRRAIVHDDVRLAAE